MSRHMSLSMLSRIVMLFLAFAFSLVVAVGGWLDAWRSWSAEDRKGDNLIHLFIAAMFNGGSRGHLIRSRLRVRLLSIAPLHAF